MRVARVEVVLVCEHVRYFSYTPPRVGERIWCVACEDMRRVTGAPGDYRATCDTCTGLYVTRKAPDTLRRQVVKHLTANPQHTVTVWQIGTADAVRVQMPTAGHLDGFDSPDTLAFGA